MAALTLNDLNQALAIALAPINDQLTLIRMDVLTLQTDLGKVQTDLGKVQTDLSAVAISTKILHAKMDNAAKGRTELLTRVPKQDGSHVGPNVEYLGCIEQLLVAGNETLPSGNKNSWNSDKSLALIREYDEGYDTDGYGNEEKKSRRRRMVLAKHLGVSSSQLNLAQINLAFY